MLWIRKHKKGWRVAILVLMLVAICAPWTFDLIYVPAEYTCSAPNVRLDGNFCGLPMPGLWILFIFVATPVAEVVALVSGAVALADFGAGLFRGLLACLLLLALVLPFFGTLRLVLRGDRRRWQVIQLVVWGLAAGIGLVIGLSSFHNVFWVLWGIWLYIGLAASALILEGLALAAERSSA